MKWGPMLKRALTRHWGEKLLAVLVALLFWYMIRVQIARSSLHPIHDRAPRVERL